MFVNVRSMRVARRCMQIYVHVCASIDGMIVYTKGSLCTPERFRDIDVAFFVLFDVCGRDNSQVV